MHRAHGRSSVFHSRARARHLAGSAAAPRVRCASGTSRGHTPRPPRQTDPSAGSRSARRRRRRRYRRHEGGRGRGRPRTPSSSDAIWIESLPLVGTSTPTQIIRSTRAALAASTATAGSWSIRNRWQWVSTAVDWTGGSGFEAPIGQRRYPVSTSGEQGELHVKHNRRKPHPPVDAPRCPTIALSPASRRGRAHRPCAWRYPPGGRPTPQPSGHAGRPPRRPRPSWVHSRPAASGMNGRVRMARVTEASPPRAYSTPASSSSSARVLGQLPGLLLDQVAVGARDDLPRMTASAC